MLQSPLPLFTNFSTVTLLPLFRLYHPPRSGSFFHILIKHFQYTLHADFTHSSGLVFIRGLNFSFIFVTSLGFFHGCMSLIFPVSLHRIPTPFPCFLFSIRSSFVSDFLIVTNQCQFLLYCLLCRLFTAGGVFSNSLRLHPISFTPFSLQYQSTVSFI